MKITIFIIFLFYLPNQILFSQPGWIQQSSGTLMDLYSVHFPNIATGYICGNINIILKTTNEGANWNSLNSLTFQYSYRILFTSPDTGFISVNDAIYKTFNGGINWVILNTNTQYGFFDFCFPSKDTGYGISDGTSEHNVVRKTTNAGINWLNQNLNLSDNYYLRDIHFINNNTGFIVGEYYQSGIYKSVFLKTTNGGSNWLNQQISGSNPYIYKCVYFTSQNNGLIGSAYNGVKRTTDGGQNWSPIVFVTEDMMRIYFPSENTGYFVGYNNSIYKSTDNGVNWYTSNNNVNATLIDVFFINNNTGYIVGGSGKIYKTTNGGTTSLTPISNLIPLNYSLTQNYPNPFNPVTKIKFDIAPDSRLRENDNVVLKIFDIMGREVATLVNEQLQPGTYEVEWDGTNFSSGIYYYKLITGVSSETKKMILVK